MASGPPSIGGTRPARDAVVGFALATITIAVAGQLGNFIPVVGSNLGAIAAIAFLMIPYVYAGRFGEDLHDYGFRAEPVAEGLRFAFGVPLIVFPLFTAVFFLFYEVVCHVPEMAVLAPPGMCSRYGGIEALHLPNVDWKVLELLFIQVVVVALPEEVFFRGFVHQLLERALPPRRRLAGGGVGVALLISSALFAIGHLAVSPDPRRLSVFFPGLLFGWVFSRTRSVLAGTLIHALSNVFIFLLERSF